MSNASSQPVLFPVLSFASFPVTSPAPAIIIAMARVEITMTDRIAVLFVVYLSGMYLCIVPAVLGGSDAEIGVGYALREGAAWVRVDEQISLTCDSETTMVIVSMAI
jgi:hypothetical protein